MMPIVFNRLAALAFQRVPHKWRRAVRKMLPQSASDKLIAYLIGIQQSMHLPPDPIVSRDSPRTLFDAHWYSKNYHGVPVPPDEAWEHFVTVGARQGNRPGSAFVPLIPERARIPLEHMLRVVGSPILSRVAATRYLSLYQVKKGLHKEFQTFEEYTRRAIGQPNLIGDQLWENDIRMIAFMDRRKRKLYEKYKSRPQSELVTIVMPTHNRSDVIPDAIVSVLMQSYENWELVIVDDAGDNSDELATVIESFGDERIVCIRHEERRGNGLARNAGLEIARGTVIAHMDDDDQWDPDHLLILLNEMRDQGARAAYGAQAVWAGFDDALRLGKVFRCIRFAPFNRSLLENTNYISMISMIHERRLLDEVGRFDTKLRRYLDWEFFLRLTETEVPLAVPCILSHYYQDRKRDTVSNSNHVDASLRALRTATLNRSTWMQVFRTSDRTEHILSSTSQSSQVRRRALRGPETRPVTILIPNYDSLYEIGVCLDMIVKHTPEPHRVLIVDNGSSPEVVDGIAALIKGRPNAELAYETQEAGFSYAVNAGMRIALSHESDVLILNNDAIVTPDWLCELQHVLTKHKSVGMAVPRQVTPARHRLIKAHVPGADDRFECDVNLSMHHRNVLNPYFDVQDGLIELSYAPLFCGLIRKEVAHSVGNLDAANGPHFRSDWILADDLTRAGQRIVYTPHSKVYHLHGVATAKRKFN